VEVRVKDLGRRSIGGMPKVTSLVTRYGHNEIPSRSADRPKDGAGYSRGARIRTGDLLLPKRLPFPALFSKTRYAASG